MNGQQPGQPSPALPVWLPVWIWIASILLLVPTGRMLTKLFARAIGRGGLRVLLLTAGALLLLRALAVLPAALTRVGPIRGALALLCVAGFGASLLWSPLPEEILHPLQYLPLALLLERALATRWPPMKRSACILLIAAAVAVGDEGLQHAMPGRVFDPQDVVLDIVGAGLPLAFLRLTGLEIRPGDES